VFSEREQAVLAWTEALTLVVTTPTPTTSSGRQPDWFSLVRTYNLESATPTHLLNWGEVCSCRRTVRRSAGRLGQIVVAQTPLEHPRTGFRGSGSSCFIPSRPIMRMPRTADTLVVGDRRLNQGKFRRGSNAFERS